MFRKRLEVLFKERNTSITEFADLLGLTRQSLSYYMSGDRRPDLQTLKRICETLDVSADWLLGLSDIRSADKNLQTACQTLGLSEAAAENIRLHNGNALNDLLTDYNKYWDAIDLYLKKYELSKEQSGIPTSEKDKKAQDEIDDEIFQLDTKKGINYSNEKGEVVLSAGAAAAYYSRIIGDLISKHLEALICEEDMADIE